MGRPRCGSARLPTALAPRATHPPAHNRSLRRLSAARVLIAGLGGLAAEVAKNVVLAGVGSVTLCDDTPLADRPPSNFLIHAADAATGRT